MTTSYLIGDYTLAYFNNLTGARGLADNTVLAYRDTLKLLFCFAADRLSKTVDELSLPELDQQLVLDFLGHLENQRGH